MNYASMGICTKASTRTWCGAEQRTFLSHQGLEMPSGKGFAEGVIDLFQSCFKSAP